MPGEETGWFQLLSEPLNANAAVRTARFNAALQFTAFTELIPFIRWAETNVGGPVFTRAFIYQSLAQTIVPGAPSPATVSVASWFNQLSTPQRPRPRGLEARFQVASPFVQPVAIVRLITMAATETPDTMTSVLYTQLPFDALVSIHEDEP